MKSELTKTLEKLGDSNIGIEKEIVKKEQELGNKGKEYNVVLHELQNLKKERHAIRKDIKMACSGKKPLHSSQFKEKKKAKK